MSSTDSLPERTFLNVPDTRRLQQLQREAGGSSSRANDPYNQEQFNVCVVCWFSRCKGLKIHRMDVTATHQMRWGLHPSAPSQWGALTTPGDSSSSQVILP